MPASSRSSSPQSELLIRSIGTQVEQLVRDNWLELWSYGDREKGAKATVAIAISPNGNGQDYALASSITFGIRVKHRTKQNLVSNA